MVTLSVLTLYLAQAIGLYMILVGLGALVKPERWRQMLDEIIASPALTMLSGVIAFALGVTLVYIHSILSDPLAIAVTLVGWIALVKGALLIVVPGPLLRLGIFSLRFVRLWAILCIILGLLLGVAGLIGTAGNPHIV